MKKKLTVFLGLTLFLSAGALAVGRHFWRGPTLDINKVGNKWGKESFDEGKFFTGAPVTRAPMAASLIKNKKTFIGLDRSEIRKRLGDYDGFYFSDMFPTYLIEEGQTPDQDSWQLVFLLDRKEKVADIIVHKNCCDR